jgi:hypothetical protein
MINVRRLAALDLQFLGPKIILTEFGLGVLGPIALGILTMRAGLHRFHSARMMAFGVYLLLLGINYVPLLLHAIDWRDTAVRDRKLRTNSGTSAWLFANTAGSRRCFCSRWSYRSQQLSKKHSARAPRSRVRALLSNVTGTATLKTRPDSGATPSRCVAPAFRCQYVESLCSSTIRESCGSP